MTKKDTKLPVKLVRLSVEAWERLNRFRSDMTADIRRQHPQVSELTQSNAVLLALDLADHRSEVILSLADIALNAALALNAAKRDIDPHTLAQDTDDYDLLLEKAADHVALAIAVRLDGVSEDARTVLSRHRAACRDIARRCRDQRQARHGEVKPEDGELPLPTFTILPTDGALSMH